MFTLFGSICESIVSTDFFECRLFRQSFGDLSMTHWIISTAKSVSLRLSKTRCPAWSGCGKGTTSGALISTLEVAGNVCLNPSWGKSTQIAEDCFAIYEIKCLELFRETKKTFRFVISHIFTEILYLFFEFCTFDSSTFYSILVPFT